MTAPPCTAPYCDRLAIAAVYCREPSGRGSIVIRPDHLQMDVLHAPMHWRCIDCLHNDIDIALSYAPDKLPSQ